MRSILGVLLLLGGAAASAQSVEDNRPARSSGSAAFANQIIVKWRDQPAAPSTASAKMRELSASTGLGLSQKGSLSVRTEVLKIEDSTDPAALAHALAELNAWDDVEYAVADQWRYAHAIPSDPLFTEQWYLRSAHPAATRLEEAWDLTQGSPTTIVAVLDSGVRFEHPDLGRVENGGKLLPGFDFVSNSLVANDGGAQDDDPSDPGDWVTPQDTQQAPFNSGDCEPSNSSWHGTRVSAVIGAMTNNAAGVAGGAWNTLVLPVRVLGKCGGSDSDIIAGIRWAAGLAVPGAPINPTPAHIINLSLGGEGACSPAYRAAIDEVRARGVLVISSAGNDGAVVTSPANCSGVVAVGAVRHAGTKVGYSNLGPQVTLSAPGGNCGVEGGCQYSITVATNSGATTPSTSTYTLNGTVNVGTSFAAPIVASAAALMHAVNSQLTPTLLTERLRQSATPFTTSSSAPLCRIPAGPDDVQDSECVCTTQTCGAGMLNGRAAVVAAQRPIAAVSAPSLFEAGQQVQIDASSSLAANGRTLQGWEWTVENVVGAAPTIADVRQAQTTLLVPAGSQFTLRLTVTDNQGAQDSAQKLMQTTVAPASPPTPPPSEPAAPASSGGGGGGGALNDLFALLLGALGSAALLRRRRHQLARDVA